MKRSVKGLNTRRVAYEMSDPGTLQDDEEAATPSTYRCRNCCGNEYANLDVIGFVHDLYPDADSGVNCKLRMLIL